MKTIFVLLSVGSGAYLIEIAPLAEILESVAVVSPPGRAGLAPGQYDQAVRPPRGAGRRLRLGNVY